MSSCFFPKGILISILPQQPKKEEEKVEVAPEPKIEAKNKTVTNLIMQIQ